MKQKMQFYSIDFLWRMPLLLFLLVIYLGGTIIGTFTGILGYHSANLQNYLQYFLQEGTQTTLLLQRIAGAVSSTMLWLFLCILSGFFVPSLLLCSAVIALKGFLLSFSVSAMIVAYGTKGVLLSLASQGLSAIVSIPCLLLTGAAVLETSGSLPKGQRRRYFPELTRFRGAIFICAVLSILAAALRAGVQPLLLQWIEAFL